MSDSIYSDLQTSLEWMTADRDKWKKIARRLYNTLGDFQDQTVSDMKAYEEASVGYR